MLRTNLSQLRVQRWALLGFNPWHRVLLRQSISEAANEQGICTQFDVHDHETVASMHQNELLKLVSIAHVLVITKETFLTASPSHEQPLARSLSKDQIAILWDWSALGPDALSWATCVGFGGVIFDIATLRSWSSIAVQRGVHCLEEPHPILSKIQSLSLTRVGTQA
ncbi:MAG: hypothetical protein NTY42_07890 [Planctomycetota bacterium]|nr:hypothetical protein [Planctomycetota bacterium]